MAESNAGVNKFMNGDTDLNNQLWILKIAARDLILGLACCIIWQWVIIDSPFSVNLRPLKFNKDY